MFAHGRRHIRAQSDPAENHFFTSAEIL